MYQVCDCFGDVLVSFPTLEAAQSSPIKGRLFLNYAPGYYRDLGRNYFLRVSDVSIPCVQLSTTRG